MKWKGDSCALSTNSALEESRSCNWIWLPKLLQQHWCTLGDVHLNCSCGQANNRIRLPKLLKQHRRAFWDVHLNCSCGHINKERKFLNCCVQNFSCRKIYPAPEETMRNAISSHQSWWHQSTESSDAPYRASATKSYPVQIALIGVSDGPLTIAVWVPELL